MNSGSNHASRYKGHDFLWWGVASILGLWSMWMPQMLKSAMGQETQPYFIYGALCLGGVLIGLCRRERPWRWGLAAMLVLPLGDLAWAAHDPRLNVLSAAQILSYVAERAPQYMVQALPVLVGAYVGSLLTEPQES